MMLPLSSKGDSPEFFEIKILKISELDQKIAKAAIKEINDLVNWDKHTSSILNKYFDNSHMRVALKGDEIVGYITFRDYVEGKPKAKAHLYVPYIAVAPDHQGVANGNVAMKLMKEVMSIAENSGQRKVILHYRASNSKTAKFYHKICKAAKVDMKDRPKGNYQDDGTVKNKVTYILKAEPSPQIKLIPKENQTLEIKEPSKKEISHRELGERIYDIIENAYKDSSLEKSLGKYMGSSSTENLELRELQNFDYSALTSEEIKENLNKIKTLIEKGFNQLPKNDSNDLAMSKVLTEISNILKDM